MDDVVPIIGAIIGAVVLGLIFGALNASDAKERKILEHCQRIGSVIVQDKVITCQVKP